MEPCLIRILALAMVLSAASSACAQPSGALPRTSDGKPDLQGTWTNSSITLLERSNPSLPLTLNAEQVTRMETSRAQENAADAAPTTTQEAPQAGIAIVPANLFWADRGGKVGVVNGEPRSSWIVDPANGKMPVSDAGRKRISSILAKRSEEGPEGMNPADRCLVASRGSGGPPMLNNLYNNNYRIVQTPGYVMIEVEMMHDVRIIRMEQSQKPGALKQWLGDSIGRWDGDTLVVTTRNWKRLHGDYEPVFLSENAVVTERFTRSGKDEITYAFTVDDPGFYTQAWKGEMVFTTSSGPLYEYACHEGNYALHNILHGARIRESRK